MIQTKPEDCGKVARRWYVTLFGRRWGFEHSTVHFVNGSRKGQKYLERYILYFGFGTLRLHAFRQGDDIRAPHDHPWSFITFPLHGYWETVSAPEPPYRGADLVDFRFIRYVKPFRFHYRHATFRHIVHMRHPHVESTTHYRFKPIWTIVVTGTPKRHGRSAVWGFYPEPDQLVAFADWETYCATHNL